MLINRWKTSILALRELQQVAQRQITSLLQTPRNLRGRVLFLGQDSPLTFRKDSTQRLVLIELRILSIAVFNYKPHLLKLTIILPKQQPIFRGCMRMLLRNRKIHSPENLRKIKRPSGKLSKWETLAIPERYLQPPVCWGHYLPIIIIVASWDWESSLQLAVPIFLIINLGNK